MAPAKSSIVAPDIQDKLQKLNDNQRRWRDLPLGIKLKYLENIEKRMGQAVTMDDWESLGAWSAHTMMGIPANTAEGQFVKTTESALPLLVVKPTVERLVEAYRMACDCNPNQKAYAQKLVPRRMASNKSSSNNSHDQVVLDVFPLLTQDKFGPFGALHVEWWLDPSIVKSVEDAPQPFAVDLFSDNAEEGVMVVLGAGNQSFLTLVDLLEGLFVRQRTVLVKHHPLRGCGLDPLTRKIFQPLYDAGFLDSVLDLGTPGANSALVYHPLVHAVHMTGGKPTHDAIVWGSTWDEQDKRKLQRTPKLTNAEMSSELGCITPWIMVPSEYTHKQLLHHAEILVAGLHRNASSNCLSPKVVVMDENWAQKDAFMQCLKQVWQSLELPVAYYPGCQKRWMAYKEQYPSAVEWDSNTGRGIKERQLAPPMMNAARGDKEATLLPLLCVDLQVDLTTQKGRQAAKAQYAFQQEPFCPVVTFATIQNTTKLADYMETVARLCNDYIYGSLSCSMSVPTSLEMDPSVETAIAGLKYGSIGVNLWSGFCYQFAWGGHASQECLECVESGLGRTNNYLFVRHLEKVVVRAPFLWSTHPKVNPDYAQAKKELDAVATFVVNPGVLNLLKLLGATINIPKSVTLGVAGAVVAAVVALVVARR